MSSFSTASRGNLCLAPIQHGARIWSLAFSPDGKTLLTMGDDDTVRFWNSMTGELIGRPALQHKSAVFRAAYSPDGSLIATVSGDKTARFWDAETGAPVGPSLQHIETIYALAFHPSRRELITAGNDSRDAGRIWPVPQPFRGQPLAVFSKIEMLTGLALHEDHSMSPLTPAQWRERNSQGDSPDK